jgi:DNA polymerase I-like protein with 3'-5' exonuclease and polymerase domains
MVFYYPTCTINKWGRLSDSTIIANYTIQSLSTAEIIPIALIHFWHRIEDKPVELFSTVHDSIISWVREDFVEEYKELSKEAFTRDVDVFLQRVYNYQFVTPLGCGIKVGSHWGEGREAKYDWFPQKQEWVVR